MQPSVNTKNVTNVAELYVKPITQLPVLCDHESTQPLKTRSKLSSSGSRIWGGRGVRASRLSRGRGVQGGAGVSGGVQGVVGGVQKFWRENS